jgi:NitT/TauT family transport system permease protein
VNRAVKINFWRVSILIVLLAFWQWGYDLRTHHGWPIPLLFDPYFVSAPSRVVQRLLQLSCAMDRAGNFLISDYDKIAACLVDSHDNLWRETAATLRNTFWGFVVGVGSGVAVGLILGRFDTLAQIIDPYIVAFNSLPRIALVPLIILMFGLGDLSKIMTAWVIVFFVVFFNTFEGVRAVERDHINASRLLGASEWQITATVVVPSAMTWVFASLTPAASFALIGVIVGEFIGTEAGLGKIIIEAEARSDSTNMMAALVVLMVVGALLAVIVRRVQAYCLRWQPHFQERR